MSTSGGSAWNKINGDSIKYGYVVSVGGALYQVGAWWDLQTRPHMALVRSPGDTGPWTRSIISMDSSEARAFAVHTANPNVLYVGGYVGMSESQWTTHYACLYKSTNTGASWTRLAASMFTATPECVYGICIDPSNPARVIAITDKGAYRTTNSGTSWTTPVQAFAGTSIVADPAVAGRFFAGAKDGVYESTDAGVNWVKISKGLPGKTVTSLTYDAAAQRLVAGTYGGGIYRLSFIPTGVAGTVEGLPGVVVLEQNYPNPFNPTTVVSFQLPVLSYVKLAAYDLLGREVAVLSEGWRAPGRYAQTFEGTGLASGVYVCRLTAGAAVLTRRMVLVR
jgi:hypothetical protein